MKTLILSMLILFAAAVIPGKAMAQFQWPGTAKAAVCFTYDDGLDCHLDVAVPQLDAVGFKGTFYCTGNSPSLFSRMEDWRKIARNGHELGNHTLFHPCDGQRLDWVKPEYDLNSYTTDRLLNELRTANTLLKAIDGNERRTYAYTCGDYMAGGEDYKGLMKPLFPAARGEGVLPQTMDDYNLYYAPSWMVEDHSAEEMIAYVKAAAARGTVAIFMFHSVGGGYLNVNAEEHRKLLEYLNLHRDEYYVATFLEVTDYISRNR